MDKDVISAGARIPSYMTIVCELIMNSIDSEPTNIRINFDLFHNEIRCKDNGKGIPKKEFFSIFDECGKGRYKRNVGYLKLISYISNITIFTRTNDDKRCRYISKGEKNDSCTLISNGTEVVVSKIFNLFPIRKEELLYPNDNYQNIKKFINTISLLYHNIEFELVYDSKKYKISFSNSIEERWKSITGVNLKMDSDGIYTYYRSKINFGSYQFEPYIINGFPCKEVIVDNKELKLKKNSTLLLNGEIKDIRWEFDGLYIKINTCFKQTESTYSIVGNNELLHMKFIGIFDYKFILCHFNNVLYAIDQHAAHERVNLEQILDNIPNPFKSYNLKKAIALPPSINNMITNETKAKLKRWGWTIASELKTSYVLYTVPIYEGIIIDLIQDLFDYIDSLTSGIKKEIPDCIMHAFQTKACKKAIKFGDIITEKEAISLIHSLSKCKRPNNCAHGRTVVAPLMNLNEKFISFAHL